jgi:hypothetical protein
MKIHHENFICRALKYVALVFCLLVAQTTRADFFSASGSMNSPRMIHTATLLPDGMVLVAGGSDDFFTEGATDTSEIYHPFTETWTETGVMNTARWQHTASLIEAPRRIPKDWHWDEKVRVPKVLVTGGEDIGGQPTASAELYDLDKKTWEITGAMNVPRDQHTASVLNDGRVLVAGGAGNSAELYDPLIGTWTLTGGMSTSRYNHTATLLSNGKVLVAGGTDGLWPLSSAELFDPRTGKWTLTGSMTVPRAYHTATLLNNGTVLVAGGFNLTSVYLSSSEIYDPRTGTWTAITNQMITARGHHTATLLFNGMVLLAGGYNGGASGLSSAELFEPSNKTWTAVPEPMTTARLCHTATLLQNGNVLIAGGIDGTFGPPQPLSSSELFNPKMIKRPDCAFAWH